MNPPPKPEEILNALYQRIEQRRKERPENSYVARLSEQGRDRILQKVGEEAVEVVLAGKNGDAQKIIEETADLWFHTLIMLAEQNITPGQVLQELAGRYKK